MNGSWVGDLPGNNFGENTCRVSPAAGFQQPPGQTPPAAGTDTYRTTIRSSTSSSTRAVKVGANYTPIPQ